MEIIESIIRDKYIYKGSIVLKKKEEGKNTFYFIYLVYIFGNGWSRSRCR